MRDQLIQYVNLLFAGNDNVEDIKQEILQNTLDRYDDLISRGGKRRPTARPSPASGISTKFSAAKPPPAMTGPSRPAPTRRRTRNPSMRK